MARRYLQTLLPIVFLALLAGCNAMMGAKVLPDSETPQFVFNGIHWPAPCKLFGLTIVETKSGMAVWRITSDGARIESVRYGEVPVGFVERVPPQPLKAAAAYEVRLDGGQGCALARSSQFQMPVPR